MRSLLRLAEAPRRPDAALIALAAVPLVLGVAAAQPALRSERTARARSDAEAYFVVDISRSMLASAGPGAATRLSRARGAAVRLRAAIPEVPAGVASLTDRVLPHLFPTIEEAPFASTVREALAVGRPPPQVLDVEATSFQPLAALATQGFFDSRAKRRIVVLLTDGESRPFDAAAVGRALRAPPGISLVVVRFWRAGERVYGPDGRAEAAYRPDPGSAGDVARLAAAAGGRAFEAGGLSAAAAAVSADAGRGPTARRGAAQRTRTLGPYVALGALGPLGLLLLRRRRR